MFEPIVAPAPKIAIQDSQPDRSITRTDRGSGKGENIPALPIFLPNFFPFSSNLVGTLFSCCELDEPDCETSRGKFPYLVGCGEWITPLSSITLT